MANMSYCRFQNTLSAFKDCYAELNEAESFSEMRISEEETAAMNRLAAYARLYLERFSELQELEEFEFARNMDDGA
jgi:hypothetical protein